MNDAYSIWIVSSPDFVWSHVFDDVAISLQSAFKTLGYDAPIVRDAKDIRGTAVVLGPHLFPCLKMEVPEKDLILFNLEQAHPDSGWFRPDYGYIDILKKYPVWDFSRINMEILKSYGVDNIVLCPLGYAPELTRVRSQPEDKNRLDVLFIGRAHFRRTKILSDLKQGGARVHQVVEAFGRDCDKWLTRAKIHLNIHQAPAQLLEIPRVSYLLANKCFVISEIGRDQELENKLADGMVFCNYEDIADKARYYLQQPEECRRIAERGFELIQKMPQSEFLKRALEAHRKQHPNPKAVAPKALKTPKTMAKPGKQYCIWIVSSPDFIWSHIFDEVAVGLQSAFTSLGYDAPVVRDAKDIRGTAIALGANWMQYLKIEPPDNIIIFNLEQAHPESGWFMAESNYISLLKKYPVWDFSRANIETLKSFGVKNIVLCPVGYAPELTHIPLRPENKEDVDVLFIGGPHNRRTKVLAELHQGGARVHQVVEAFGEERDQWLARAKIHLNIHQAPARLLEIPRVSYLLANKRFVISETGNDPELEKELAEGMVFCKYEDMVEQARYYLQRPEERRRIAERGFELMRKMPQSEFLKRALKEQSDNELRITDDKKKDPLSIFVTIASYRDPECQWTVKNLFEKATHPERIYVGICWQYDPAEDMACFEVEYPRPEQVRVVQYHSKDSRGANWARSEAFKLWDGEKYALVIDSHMRFEKGWDEFLLDALKRCPGEKSLLTAWLPGYKPPNKRDASNGKIPRLRVSGWGVGSDAQLVNLNRFYASAAEVKGRMDPSCSCVANFTFGPAKAFSEVPFDPYIDFWGDEVNQSARMWTHGWNFFQLDSRVAYHYWDPDNIKDRDVYRNREHPRHQRARIRNLHLFGIQSSSDVSVLAELDKYPLGAVRKIEDYWRFMGIDFATKTIKPHAGKGEWKLLPQSDNGKRMTDNKKMPSPPVIPHPSFIFVNIASYRDPETQATVKDLFEKAAHPERIRVGICLQADAAEDKKCMVDDSIRTGQIRITQVHYKDSKGANWARAEAQKLWNGEEYVLQIDSHMRFEPGWDDALPDMLKRCPSQRAVLSTYAPRYTPPDNREKTGDNILRIRVHMFGEPGSSQLLHLTRVSVPRADRERSGLYISPFYVANFMFCRAGVLKEIPFDPHIRFWGDEITYSARLWTHGIDVYQPDRVVLYHYWRRDELVPIQPYRRDNKNSLSRVKHLLGFETAPDPKALADIERYGLGDKRNLKDLWAFIGIDWQKRTIAKSATEGKWTKPAEKKNGAFAVIRNPSPVSSIFVNIASYRDPECQWTVKDLFEKATHPDRINVGICWQYDPEEDKDCFKVSTRPNQVRMLPVDWREAEGVCWARHETQKLWDGEGYTLMTDSHMRFVPGWDELMIKELEACESDKPLLSCSPPPYVPPNQLAKSVNPTIRRVKPFFPDGNIRCQGETLDRAPEKPLKGAFMVANFAFSRANVIEEVPYDPYLYFDQEEITYATRLYTHGWDIFSSRQQFLYHFYNDGKAGKSNRPLHWRDLHKKDSQRIMYLKNRGLKRFNHMTGYKLSNEEDVTKELAVYGFGRARTLQQFEDYSGIDFKRKIATEKALRCLFIENLDRYRKQPIYIPEIDDKKKANGSANGAVNGKAAAEAPKPAVISGAQPAMSLKMLETGDFIPLFEITDTERRTRAVELYGGQHAILLFLPAADIDYVTAVIRHLQLRYAQGTHKNLWQLIVIDDTVDNLIELKKKVGGPHHLWADPDRKLAHAFGLIKAGDTTLPATGFVLNHNLKIVRRAMHMGWRQLVDELFDTCQVEIAHYQAKNHERRIVSETSPALIIPAALTPELCRKCMDAYHHGRKFDGTVGAEEKTGYRPNAKVRTDHIINGALLDEIDEKFSRSVFPEIKKIFGLTVTYREMYKVGVYKSEKGGFFKQHRDNFDVPLGYRRVAMTVQLNDDYEGGGLRFPEYGETTYRPAAGSGIAFSCATIHEARPVTSGERYILVCFFHGDEEEAFRRHYLAGKGSPLRIKDYAAKLRPPAAITQSRDYFKQWQSDNVSFTKSDAVSLPAPEIPLAAPVAGQRVMVSTIGDHKPTKVFESKQAIVFDNFLPDDIFQKLFHHVRSLDCRHINTTNVKHVWRIHDGFPLRSATDFFSKGAASATDKIYPTQTVLDRFFEHMLALQPHVAHMIGRQDADWERFSVTSWGYPQATGLSLHNDGAGTFTGAYTYFLNPFWRAHWGGMLLMTDDEGNRVMRQSANDPEQGFDTLREDAALIEHGFAQCIFPKRNRVVFIAKGAFHMVTRVNEAAGDHVRMSLAGFFYRKKTAV